MKNLSFLSAVLLLVCVVFSVSFAESDSLIVYTSMPLNVADTIIAGFTEQTGIKVETVVASGGELLLPPELTHPRLAARHGPDRSVRRHHPGHKPERDVRS